MQCSHLCGSCSWCFHSVDQCTSKASSLKCLYARDRCATRRTNFVFQLKRVQTSKVLWKMYLAFKTWLQSKTGICKTSSSEGSRAQIAYKQAPVCGLRTQALLAFPFGARASCYVRRVGDSTPCTRAPTNLAGLPRVCVFRGFASRSLAPSAACSQALSDQDPLEHCALFPPVLSVTRRGYASSLCKKKLT